MSRDKFPHDHPIARLLSFIIEKITYLKSEHISDDDVGYGLEAGGVSEDASTHGYDRDPAGQPHACRCQVEPR